MLAEGRAGARLLPFHTPEQPAAALRLLLPTLAALAACWVISLSLQPLQAALLSKGLGWAQPRLTWAIGAVARLQKSGFKLVEHWRRLQGVQQGRLLDSCVHQRHYNALDRRSALEPQTS